MIEYERKRKRDMDSPVTVKLDGKIAGEIRPIRPIRDSINIYGWRYFPKGQVVGGEAFRTLRDCKMDIEGITEEDIEETRNPRTFQDNGRSLALAIGELSRRDAAWQAVVEALREIAGKKKHGGTSWITFSIELRAIADAALAATEGVKEDGK